VFQLKAYDPDIPDRDEPQHIVYNVVPKQEQHTFLTISNNGCLSLLKVGLPPATWTSNLNGRDINFFIKE
jgi:hypothetical protein